MLSLALGHDCEHACARGPSDACFARRAGRPVPHRHCGGVPRRRLGQGARPPERSARARLPETAGSAAPPSRHAASPSLQSLSPFPISPDSRLTAAPPLPLGSCGASEWRTARSTASSPTPRSPPSTPPPCRLPPAATCPLANLARNACPGARLAFAPPRPANRFATAPPHPQEPHGRQDAGLLRVRRGRRRRQTPRPRPSGPGCTGLRSGRGLFPPAAPPRTRLAPYPTHAAAVTAAAAAAAAAAEACWSDEAHA
jgi:hypothetical protein